MSFWPQILSIAARLDQASYYEVLGIERDAGGDAIVARYFELAARLHPDRHARGAAPDQLAALNRVNARLGEAKRVLTTPALRAAYDSGLVEGYQRLEADRPRRIAPTPKTPKHPMARQLLEQAQAMSDRDRARKTLELALQYEPGSTAISEALAKVQPPPRRTVAAPAAVAVEATAPATAPATATATASAPASAPASASASATATAPAPATATAPVAAQAAPVAGAVRIDEPAELREQPRVGLSVPIKLKLPSWKHVEILITRDVSRGGMFLRSAKLLDIGATVELQILPPIGDVVCLSAEVVHVVQPGGAAIAGMGLRFLDIPAEALVALDALLTRHGG